MHQEQSHRQRLGDPAQQLLLLQRRLVGGHLVGDVVQLRENDDVVGVLGVREGVLDLDPEPGAALHQVPDPDPGRLPAGRQVEPVRDRGLVVVRVQERQRPLADHLRGREAQHPGHVRVDADDVRVDVLAHHRVPGPERVG